MKFSKIVYVRYIPLTKAIYEDLYFEELKRNNISVEYLDVSNLFPQLINQGSAFDFEGTIKISTYKQLSNYLKSQNNKTTLYISIMTYDWTVLKLFRVFTKLNLYLGVFARGVFPNDTSSNLSKITRILKLISYKRIVAFIKVKIAYLSKKWGYIKTYDYILKAGEFGYWGLGIGSELDVKTATVIEVNTVDYDKFLLRKMAITKADGNFIVFLDQYLPYHPDALLLNISTVNPDIYYKEINLFFDKIESLTGKKIVIAAHPKAERYKEFNPYNNRELYIGMSNDLVRDASLVLMHVTTAICFPICYQKRIILLISTHLAETFPSFIRDANTIANACGASIINIDKQDKIEIPSQIKINKYNDYKYKYLTSLNSENQLSSDIFFDFIKK